MRLRLRDERLEVLARAAGWSAANLAARLGIDLRKLKVLKPDRDFFSRGGRLEVICDIFGITEDEYCHFSPRFPAENAPRMHLSGRERGGLLAPRAAIAKREKSRKVDRLKSIIARCVPANPEGCAANGLSLPPPAPLLGRLQQGRQELQAKLLAKVDMGLGRGEPPRDRRCRYKRQVYLDGANIPELQAQRYRKHFERSREFLEYHWARPTRTQLVRCTFFRIRGRDEHSFV